MLVARGGLCLTKPELGALLAFASRDESLECSWVSFCIGDGRVLAYATDTVKAVEADGPSKAIGVGEWFLGRRLLKRAYSNLEAGQVARFGIPDRGLGLVRIEEGGQLLGVWKDGTNSVSTQLAFPEMNGKMAPPRSKKHRGVGRGMLTPRLVIPETTVEGRVMLSAYDGKLVTVVAAAAGVESVDAYAPEKPYDLAMIRAAGDGNDATVWTAKFKPEVAV